MQSGNGRRRIDSSKGFALLFFVGLIAIISAIIFGRMALNTEAFRQDRTGMTQDGLNRAKAFVLDYLRKNKVLPDVSTFQTGTSDLTDAWGRRFLYFPSSALLSGNVCAITTTNIALSQCGNDPACSLPTTTTNIPFLILSGGEYVKSTTDPVFQTSPYTDSVPIASAATFKQYRSRLDVGPYATPTDVNAKAFYDDLLLITSLSEIYSTAGCLSNTQGDVQNSGGVLKILNTAAALPPAVCPTPYSKELFAYGRTGPYTWSITGLPPGLTSTTPGTSSIISGTPTTAGNYNISATATDSAGKANSHTYTLAVSALPACCGWTDTGATQTLACAAGFTGSISQKQQTRLCDGTTQWVTTANTCTPITATFDGTFAELIAAGAFPGSNLSSGQTSLILGSGANQLTISTTNPTCQSTSSCPFITRFNNVYANPSLGMTGGLSNAIDAGQTMNFQFDGGFGRLLGIEFKGLQTDNGIEKATIVFKDTTSGVTVATRTVTACMLGSTTNSTFSLPDVGAAFNRIEVTANNLPATTDFYVRGLRTCDVGAPDCYPAGSSPDHCLYP